MKLASFTAIVAALQKVLRRSYLSPEEIRALRERSGADKIRGGQ